MEVNLNALRIAKQNDLSALDFYNLTMDNIDEVADKHLVALKSIERDKLRVARAYNKKVELKKFQVGDLVWKVILPIGSREKKFGKWSPSWEGALRITRVVPGNSYLVESVQGTLLPRALNGKYLKKYHPNMWQEA